MPTAYIGIGSNLGNRAENCVNAITLLIADGVRVTSISSMIETEPWGIKEQPKFINMAIQIQTPLAPDDLLKLLKDIEVRSGRVPGPVWGPRIVDLDILFYEDLVMKTPELEIPHPGAGSRDFVLKPLAEIAPELIHPVLKKSVRELLHSL